MYEIVLTYSLSFFLVDEASIRKAYIMVKLEISILGVTCNRWETHLRKQIINGTDISSTPEFKRL